MKGLTCRQLTSTTALAMVLTVTMVTAGSRPSCVIQRWQSSDFDPDLRILIDELSTARRAEAKRRLSEIGPRAAPALTTLLDHLIVRAEEGPFIGGDPDREGGDSQNDPVGIATIYRHQTIWEVIDECVELLGQMRWTGAIPSILKVLELRKARPLHDNPAGRPESVALTKIGAPAVSFLIDAFEHADLLEEASQENGSYESAVEIQNRTAFVLGEIGDPRAIPALEDLITEDPDFQYGEVSDALAKILLRQQAR